MADDSMTLFVNLSALLTGIQAGMLAPGIDPINIKVAYFNTAKANDDAVFAQLLEIYSQNQTKPPDTIADILLNQSGTAVRYLCRSIMLMWYLGSWYSPEALEKGEAAGTAFIDSTVVSATAYTQGWTWSVAQAHPMGYSVFNFGYWSEDPPSLTDFIGTPENAS